MARAVAVLTKGSVDLGYHTRAATLGTHWVPTHTNTRKHHHTQTNGAKAHTRQVRCEFRQRSRRPLHRRGPPLVLGTPASDSSRAISHAAAMCSATDMRCAINDDHVRVVQLTSSSYCFLDNLSRTLSRILLNKRTTGFFYIYRLFYKKGSVDLGYHTRCHTRYALGTHTHQHKETPPHSNGAKAHTRHAPGTMRI